MTVFTNSCFVKPRDWVTWKVCQPLVSPTQLISDHVINRAVLSGPVWFPPCPVSSPTCLSLSPLPASSPPLPASSPLLQPSSPTQLGSPLPSIEDDIFLEKEMLLLSAPVNGVYMINTDFDMDLPDNASPPISSRASHESKYCFTEEQRCMAKNAVIPTSLEDLDKKVRNDFSTSLVQVILIMS